jgi:hypothetical protein
MNESRIIVFAASPRHGPKAPGIGDIQFPAEKVYLLSPHFSLAVGLKCRAFSSRSMAELEVFSRCWEVKA